MDYQVLENEELIVRVLNKGAEISSIQSKKRWHRVYLASR